MKFRLPEMVIASMRHGQKIMVHIQKSFSAIPQMSNFYHLLRRPEPQPSLDECWEPPPIFIQQNGEEKGQLFQPGLNAEWKVDFCLFKRTGFHIPTFLPHSKAQVHHSKLAIKCRRFGQVQIPLVWISFIELVMAQNDERKGRRRSRGKMTVQGRGIFKMVMFLSAEHGQVLWAIRDWLRFLVVRQRIPHLVLGLEFDWANKNGKAKAKRRRGRIGKKLANFILIFKCWHIKN